MSNKNILIIPPKIGITSFNSNILEEAFDIKCTNDIRCNSLKWLWIYNEDNKKSYVNTFNMESLSNGAYGNCYRTQKGNIVKIIKYNDRNYDDLDHFLKSIKDEIFLQSKAYNLIKDKNGNPITPKVLKGGIFIYNFEYYGIIFMEEMDGERMNGKFLKSIKKVEDLEDIILQLENILLQLKSNKMSHNDLHGGNILINDDIIVHIIDWGRADNKYRTERLAKSKISDIKRAFIPKLQAKLSTQFGKKVISKKGGPPKMTANKFNKTGYDFMKGTDGKYYTITPVGETHGDDARYRWILAKGGINKKMVYNGFGKKRKTKNIPLKIKNLCRKLKIKITIKRGSKRIYKSVELLKKQIKNKLKK